MKRILLLSLLAVQCFTLCNAQGFGYDSKTYIGNGLYKVKSGEFYGIIDKDDNVIVSIEYQDIFFKDGKALLTKDDYLHAIVDTLGSIKTFEPKYKVHPLYRYVCEGYIIVGNTKWGFITENGKPLRIKSKINELFSFGRKTPSMFDDVAPFVDGYAIVCNKKNGWKHIDKNGNERYKLGNKKTKASFRSSVYNGECFIVTSEGIKQYQENSTSQAVVKRVLSSSATFLDFRQDSLTSEISYQEGTLVLDSLMRVSRFVTGKDSIVFIEPPKAFVIPEEDTLSLEEGLRTELVHKNLQANEKGKAYTEVRLINTSNEDFEELHATVECAGARKEWSGSLLKNSEARVPFNIPARFSSTSLKRDLIISVTYKKDSVEFRHSVTIKRYTPVRSR